MLDIPLTSHILLFAFSLALTAGAGILCARVALSSDPKLIHAALAALIVTGFFPHNPWQARVIAASAGGTASSELDALPRSPLSPIATTLSAVAGIALVYLMSARPA